ncbi:glycosyltransferase [Flexivirga sp. ID2601S]|uniref:D-inositol 3-phosphate glycosyltransferase n=1 Tax=Flexivirga aerilata TaxID=1656889 RepID=A0A849ALP6_9MICO|nr:glycosyltransferase [Flexivirga aerilata]NNG41043.1 glycosyltransferase [Flexivirga aerilata]
MRIAMISEHASPLAALGGIDAGGQNVHVAALARHLAERGHDVCVYTRRDRPFDDLAERVPLAPGLTVVNVPVGPPYPVPKDELLPWMDDFSDWMQQDWSRHGRPDVVHGHFWMSGLAALRAAQATGIPMAQTFHALGAVKRRHQGAEDTSPATRVALEAAVAARADAVIATCSDEVAELSAAGVDTSRTYVVPCGVDTTAFRPGEGHGDRSGRAGPTLLTVARLVPRKGIDTIIDALAQLPTARLVIVGGPPAAELSGDAEAHRLVQVATRAGVRHQVHLAGAVAHEKMPSVYHAADVVVAAPWYEPFGITPVEAAACGRPVVATAVGGLLDTVVDGVTGFLVPPRDSRALATAVARITSSPRLSRSFGVRAAERAQDRYAWPRVAEQTEAIYRHTLTRSGAAVGSVTQ